MPPARPQISTELAADPSHGTRHNCSGATFDPTPRSVPVYPSDPAPSSRNHTDPSTTTASWKVEVSRRRPVASSNSTMRSADQ